MLLRSNTFLTKGRLWYKIHKLTTYNWCWSAHQLMCHNPKIVTEMRKKRSESDENEHDRPLLKWLISSHLEGFNKSFKNTFWKAMAVLPLKLIYSKLYLIFPTGTCTCTCKTYFHSPPPRAPQKLKEQASLYIWCILKYLNCLISSIISELSVSPCEALVMNAMYIFSRRLLFWLLSKTKSQLC